MKRRQLFFSMHLRSTSTTDKAKIIEILAFKEMGALEGIKSRNELICESETARLRL